MIISRIAHVSLGVPDVEIAIEFYGDLLGLEVLDRQGDRVFLGTGRSATFELELGPYETGLDHFAFSVRGQSALDLARQRVEGAGVEVVELDVTDEPGLTAGLTFALPTGHAMELVLESDPVGFIPLSAAPAAHHRVTGPVPLEHITLLCADIRATSEFLVEQLGFRITDSWQPSDDQPWRNTWLRSGELHHDLAMLTANVPEPEIHHFCFAVPSVADLVRVSDALAARGIALDSSMGRHVGGNNVFLYFKDPWGNRLEVNTDMARIDPAAAPRVLRAPLPFDAWREGRPPTMTAGFPCRDARPEA
jgi:catechol 2,3-dioxygenase